MDSKGNNLMRNTPIQNQNTAVKKKQKKGSWVHREISPKILFFAGLLTMIAVGVERDTYTRGILALIMIINSLIGGKKFRLLPNVIILGSLIAVHLLTPYGKVIYTIGSFPITLGAIERGAGRGFMLITLLYASRIYLSPKLQLPGHFGRLLGETFSYFEILRESEHKIHPKTFIQDIDIRLLELEDTISQTSSEEFTKDTPKGITSLRGWLFASWGYLIAISLLLRQILS